MKADFGINRLAEIFMIWRALAPHAIRCGTPLAEKERGWCVYMTKSIQYCSGPLEEVVVPLSLLKEGWWNESRRLEWVWSGRAGPAPESTAVRCAFTAENVTRGLPVQTQRRCSSKGSSVDSSRGVGGSPALSRLGSNVWVTPRGSCVRLTSCRGAGGAGCKRWHRFIIFLCSSQKTTSEKHD